MARKLHRRDTRYAVEIFRAKGHDFVVQQTWIPETFIHKPKARQCFVSMVQWAAQNHPFYRRTIPDPAAAVPILRRQEILNHNDEFLNGHAETGRTAGSTGISVRISNSPEALRAIRSDASQLVALLGGRLPRTRLVFSPDPPKSDDYMDIRSPVEEQVAFILDRYRRFNAVAITTYPSNAEVLCEYVATHGLDMTFVRRFGCYSEVFEPHQKKQIQRTFPNAQIWSTYSCSEVGMISAMCPFEPDFQHIVTHRLGVEVLDDAGMPCAEGEVGRVVLTDFINRNAPLIRYEIGDMAARGTCPCGRIKLPAFRQVLGKVRGSLLHRNGRRILFSDLGMSLREISGLRRYQVVQEALEHFRIRVVCELTQRGTPEFEHEITEAFRAHFQYLPERVQIVYEDEIRCEANGKLYASICRV